MQPIVHDGQTVYFCVDLEASGPVPGLFNMVSIGGVEVRADGEGGYTLGREFYFEIKPDFEGFDPHTETIHRLSRAHLEANGQPAKAVMQQITDFVRGCLRPGERPLFVGHNAPFDWMFVAWYYAWAGMENPFGYNALDTKALMMGRHALPWRQCNKERLVELYPHLEAPSPELVHNALADARFQAQILAALLQGGESGAA